MNYLIQKTFSIISIFFILLIIGCKDQPTHNLPDVSFNKKNEFKTEKLNKLKKNVVFINSSNEDLQYLGNDFDFFFIHTRRSDRTPLLNFLKSKGINENTKRICHARDESYKEVLTCFEKIIAFLSFHKISVNSIIPDGSDSGVFTAAKLRDHFKIETGIKANQAINFYDKNAMKKQIKNNNNQGEINLIPDLKFTQKKIFQILKKYNWEKKQITDALRIIISAFMNKNDLNNDPELVLKTTVGDGSTGVEFIKNNNQLINSIYAKVFASNHHCKNISCVSPFILEEKINGNVFRSDGYVNKDGEMLSNFVTKYAIPPKEFWQLSNGQLYINIPKNTAEFQEFNKHAISIIKALEYKLGVFHLEFIQSNKNNKIYFLEIGARVGGNLPNILTKVGLNAKKLFVLSNAGVDYQPQSENDNIIFDSHLSFATYLVQLPNIPHLDAWELKELNTINHDFLNFIEKPQILPPNKNENYSFIVKLKMQKKYYEHRLARVVFLADYKEHNKMLEEAFNYRDNFKAKVQLLEIKNGVNNYKNISFKNNQWKIKL